MVRSFNRLLAIASTASAAVLDLPVVIKGSYPSVKLDIGTPPKEHNLLFDTGSSTLWAVSTDCTPDSCPYGNSEQLYRRQYYNASASSTAVDLQIGGSIPYLGGNVKGEIYQDVFSGLDSSLEWNQTFMAVNESTWRFITADGFLGLGFSSIAEPNTTTLVETLIEDGKLEKPRFGLYYGKNLGDNGTQDGVLSIGDSYEDKYVDGKVVCAPLIKNNGVFDLWRLSLKGVNLLVAKDPTNPNSTVELDNGNLPTTHLASGTYPWANVTWSTYGQGNAIFDTGAGRLSVPDDMIESMYFNLGWNYQMLLKGEQRFTCAGMNASWAVSLVLGTENPEEDVVVSIRGDEFLGLDPQCQPPFDPSGQISFALVGGAFLQRFYTVWDFGADKVAEYKPRLGFGRLKKEYDYLYQS
jgi:saccharopepsin